MSEIHDPLEEAGAALGAVVRSGVTAMSEVTRATAARQTDRDLQVRQAADEERRAILDRTQAEQLSAALAYGRVGRDAWWDHASVDDVAAAWKAATGWETRDARAGIAMDEIRSRLQDRPELKRELRERHGLAFEDSRLRLDRERQAAEVAAADLASDVPAETQEAQRDDTTPAWLDQPDIDPVVAAHLRALADRRPPAIEVDEATWAAMERATDGRGTELPGSPDERAAAIEVSEMVETSFPDGSDRPLAGVRHAGAARSPESGYGQPVEPARRLAVQARTSDVDNGVAR